MGNTQTGEFRKEVYVWFKDAAGNVSETQRDSIILEVNDAEPPEDGFVTINQGYKPRLRKT